MSVFSCCFSGCFRFWRSPVTSTIFTPHVSDQIAMTDDCNNTDTDSSDTSSCITNNKTQEARDNVSLLTKLFTSLSLVEQTPTTLKRRVTATQYDDKDTISEPKSTKEIVTELATVTERLKALSIANHHHLILLMKSL